MLYRRVCILGAAGKIGEANTLRVQELEPAIRALRESSTVAEDQIEAMFTAEEERVATAQTLAEILLPLLSEKFSAASLYRPAAAMPAPDSHSSIEAGAIPRGESRADRTASPLLPGIADFIDEMLTQDRSPPGGGSSRRSA
ncbi:MAG TPA: hypothetical protein VHO24_11175 [Opitutaceae bacterium]|nr:hypothetical protein [Opitutaceae bacterium]